MTGLFEKVEVVLDTFYTRFFFYKQLVYKQLYSIL